PDGVIGSRWTPRIASLYDTDGDALEERDCPLLDCLKTSNHCSRELQIVRDIQQHDGTVQRRQTVIHAYATPVASAQPGIDGLVAILHDTTNKLSLEERLASLHAQVTRDPLTGVGNRAEFDRSIAELTALTSDNGPTFSLIICDIDRFKRVNDVHGHQAGDDALKVFAAALSAHSREGDLVCRYGGEEFVILAPNCDNACVTRLAESVRVAVEAMPIPSLGDKPITASFGVTEFQGGDTAETILARADRALLRAKENGRNRVVQLGTGVGPTKEKTSWTRSLFSWFEDGDKMDFKEVQIRTTVPPDLVVEKLRGFISDHNAEIIEVANEKISLRLNAIYSVGGRRRADQRITFRIDLNLSKFTAGRSEQGHNTPQSGTLVATRMEPIRGRDRRRREMLACADQIVTSLNSYLLGQVFDDDE
ncbi:MAG: GGDEF domain-containing protein, partial [Planctomycetota bacterium]